jgi:DnaK suppressor protein
VAPVPSDSTLATLRASLEEEQAQLRHQLEELERSNDPDGLGFDENFADSGQVGAQQGEQATLARSLHDQLDDVEAALQKMDDGTYGRCETCGNEIQEARLEAIPAARQCITCAAR